MPFDDPGEAYINHAGYKPQPQEQKGADLIIIQQEDCEIRLDRKTLVCTKQGLGFKIPRGKNAPDLLIPGTRFPA